MPSTTTTVGPLTLPVPAGAANSRIADPVVDGLLDYLAFWIKNSLDTKLASLTGTSSDACPTANRFPYDPTEPQGLFVKLPVPALFVWWEGRSVIDSLTAIYDRRVRTIHAMYVFDYLPRLAEVEKRVHLMNVVDATFAKAAERQRHPLYGYDGAVVGTPLYASLGVSSDMFAFKYLGGEPGVVGVDDVRPGDVDRAARRYPRLLGRFEVHELIDQDTPLIPDDMLGDIELTINATGGEAPPDEHMVRYLPSADGSEEL